MARIHPTAVVDPKAEIADDVTVVTVGPYCVVGPKVVLGARTVLEPHVVIGSGTTIGKNNHFFSFSAIGGVPQDKKYAGEETELVIGDGNTVREHCCISSAGWARTRWRVAARSSCATFRLTLSATAIRARRTASIQRA
jgi:UDP-N-acetylglucosamine acyltransferase